MSESPEFRPSDLNELEIIRQASIGRLLDAEGERGSDVQAAMYCVERDHLDAPPSLILAALSSGDEGLVVSLTHFDKFDDDLRQYGNLALLQFPQPSDISDVRIEGILPVFLPTFSDVLKDDTAEELILGSTAEPGILDAATIHLIQRDEVLDSSDDPLPDTNEIQELSPLQITGNAVGFLARVRNLLRNPKK